VAPGSGRGLRIEAAGTGDQASVNMEADKGGWVVCSPIKIYNLSLTSNVGMDPLSVTASVIAILQLTGKIISACAAYTSSIKDAPRELRTISVEIQSLQAIIRILDLTTARAMHENDSLAISLDACRTSLKELSDLLEHQKRGSNSDDESETKRARVLPTLVTLAWPLKRHRANALMDDISRHKSTITLSLATITRFVDLWFLNRRFEPLGY
jgi:hypothetical protein